MDNNFVQDHTMGAAKSWVPILVSIVVSGITWANQRWGMKIDASPETIFVIVGFITSVIVYWVPNKPPSEANTAGVASQSAIK